MTPFRTRRLRAAQSAMLRRDRRRIERIREQHLLRVIEWARTRAHFRMIEEYAL